MTNNVPNPLDDAVELVRKGISLRRALALTGLPATTRMTLTRRLNTLGITYTYRGKGEHNTQARLKALKVVGHPKLGDRGYWRRFAKLVSEYENRETTATTIQLWYGRRFGPAYVSASRSKKKVS